MKKTVWIVSVAGLAFSVASSASLAGQGQQLSGDKGRTAMAGRVYVNAKTGERVVLQEFESREGPERWNNDDDTNNGNFYFAIDNPARPTTSIRPRFGAEVADAGEIQGAVGVGALVDGFQIGYATDIPGVLADSSIPGLDVLVSFYDNDNGGNDTRAQRLAIFNVSDLPGTQGTANAWTITIDLAGGDELQLGDQDVDGDGNLDFGWSYCFQQNQTARPKGAIGPFEVLPGGYGYTNGVNSTSTSIGVVDGEDWYRPLSVDSSGFVTPRQPYITTTAWGWASNNPPGAPTWQENFASFYLVLFGSVACPADFNGDGFIDFTDFDDFVFAFEGGDPSSDFNQDGFLDFTDFDAFVAAFEAGC
ncbi:MAG: GC-type dockerin domain-anchored protein [Planctomycetota bacterium]|nr:GC-type dockerin domain-anchored protein [Planctomycetota bacterium]